MCASTVPWAVETIRCAPMIVPGAGFLTRLWMVPSSVISLVTSYFDGATVRFTAWDSLAHSGPASDKMDSAIRRLNTPATFLIFVSLLKFVCSLEQRNG